MVGPIAALTPSWRVPQPTPQRSMDPTTTTEMTAAAVTSLQSESTSYGPTIRIRRTVDADLPIISDYLSKAVVTTSENSKDAGISNLWKRKTDQLWARHDIERLLRQRLRAIQEGHKAMARMEQLFQQSYSLDAEHDQRILQYMWHSSDRLRQEIAIAARETAEDTIWRRHGTDLPPTSRSWLNHVQITAVDNINNQVMGFVEVAMLSNPAIDHCPDGTEECVIEYTNTSSKESTNDNTVLYYSPTISNLVVVSTHRRRGIGNRLLRSAEAYVAKVWGARTLSLYVQENNHPANKLYQQRGYATIASVSDERLGLLWYRTKVVMDRRSDPHTTIPEAEALSSSL